jgi:hypothetical protein
VSLGAHNHKVSLVPIDHKLISCHVLLNPLVLIGQLLRKYFWVRVTIRECCIIHITYCGATTRAVGLRHIIADGMVMEKVKVKMMYMSGPIIEPCGIGCPVLHAHHQNITPLWELILYAII